MEEAHNSMSEFSIQPDEDLEEANILNSKRTLDKPSIDLNVGHDEIEMRNETETTCSNEEELFDSNEDGSRKNSDNGAIEEESTGETQNELVRNVTDKELIEEPFEESQINRNEPCSESQNIRNSKDEENIRNSENEVIDDKDNPQDELIRNVKIKEIIETSLEENEFERMEVPSESQHTLDRDQLSENTSDDVGEGLDVVTDSYNDDVEAESDIVVCQNGLDSRTRLSTESEYDTHNSNEHADKETETNNDSGSLQNQDEPFSELSENVNIDFLINKEETEQSMETDETDNSCNKITNVNIVINSDNTIVSNEKYVDNNVIPCSNENIVQTEQESSNVINRILHRHKENIVNNRDLIINTLNNRIVSNDVNSFTNISCYENTLQGEDCEMSNRYESNEEILVSKEIRNECEYLSNQIDNVDTTSMTSLNKIADEFSETLNSQTILDNQNIGTSDKSLELESRESYDDENRANESGDRVKENTTTIDDDKDNICSHPNNVISAIVDNYSSSSSSDFDDTSSSSDLDESLRISLEKVNNLLDSPPDQIEECKMNDGTIRSNEESNKISIQEDIVREDLELDESEDENKESQKSDKTDISESELNGEKNIETNLNRIDEDVVRRNDDLTNEKRVEKELENEGTSDNVNEICERNINEEKTIDDISLNNNENLKNNFDEFNDGHQLENKCADESKDDGSNICDSQNIETRDKSLELENKEKDDVKNIDNRADEDEIKNVIDDKCKELENSHMFDNDDEAMDCDSTDISSSQHDRHEVNEKEIELKKEQHEIVNLHTDKLENTDIPTLDSDQQIENNLNDEIKEKSDSISLKNVETDEHERLDIKNKNNDLVNHIKDLIGKQKGNVVSSHDVVDRIEKLIADNDKIIGLSKHVDNNCEVVRKIGKIFTKETNSDDRDRTNEISNETKPLFSHIEIIQRIENIFDLNKTPIENGDPTHFEHSVITDKEINLSNPPRKQSPEKNNLVVKNVDESRIENKQSEEKDEVEGLEMGVFDATDDENDSDDGCEIDTYEKTVIIEPKTSSLKRKLDSSNNDVKRQPPKKKLAMSTKFLYQCKLCHSTSFKNRMDLSAHLLICKNKQSDKANSLISKDNSSNVSKINTKRNIPNANLKNEKSHVNKVLSDTSIALNNDSSRMSARKVFLCAACHVYYEYWNLYLHMLEFHKRYICLYCLGMFSNSVNLCDHLQKNHNIPIIETSSTNEYVTEKYVLSCCTCGSIVSTDLSKHICLKNNISSNNKTRSVAAVVTNVNNTSGEYPHPESFMLATMTEDDKNTKEKTGSVINTTIDKMKNLEGNENQTVLSNVKDSKIVEKLSISPDHHSFAQKSSEICQSNDVDLVHERKILDIENDIPIRLNDREHEKAFDLLESCHKMTMPKESEDELSDHHTEKSSSHRETVPPIANTHNVTSTSTNQISTEKGEAPPNDVSLCVENTPSIGVEKPADINKNEISTDGSVEGNTGLNVQIMLNKLDDESRSENDKSVTSEGSSHDQSGLVHRPEDSSALDTSVDQSGLVHRPENSSALNTSVEDDENKDANDSDNESSLKIDDSVYEEEEPEEESQNQKEDDLRLSVEQTPPPPPLVQSLKINPLRIKIKCSNSGDTYERIKSDTEIREKENRERKYDAAIDEVIRKSIVEYEQKESERLQRESEQMQKEKEEKEEYERLQQEYERRQEEFLRVQEQYRKMQESERDEDDEESSTEHNDSVEEATNANKAEDSYENNDDEGKEDENTNEGVDKENVGLFDVENSSLLKEELLKKCEKLLAGEIQPEEEQEESEPSIQLASEDIQPMALSLDEKLESLEPKVVIKECIRTSCSICTFCYHATRIAVNGKQLALHILAEHRYTPVKNDTTDDLIVFLKNSVDKVENVYFSSDTFDSCDKDCFRPFDNIYYCFQCSFTSKHQRDLTSHKRKMHSKTIQICLLCKQLFLNYSELLFHYCPGVYNPKPEDNTFWCGVCGIDSIPSAFRLLVHLRKKHNTCNICLETSVNESKLLQHTLKHKLIHNCYKCNISYRNKQDITKHLFWKHGTESIVCKKCLQKRWSHVYHFCQPPARFTCDECNLTFAKSVALKVHKRIHEGIFPYECTEIEECKEKFVSKKLLAKHIEIHREPPKPPTPPPESKEQSSEPHIDICNVDDSVTSLQDIKPIGKSKKKKKTKFDLENMNLPPLNLSSDSDSSDDEKDTPTASAETASTTDNLEPKPSIEITPSIDEGKKEDSVLVGNSVSPVDNVIPDVNEPIVNPEPLIVPDVWDHFTSFTQAQNVFRHVEYEHDYIVIYEKPAEENIENVPDSVTDDRVATVVDELTASETLDKSIASTLNKTTSDDSSSDSSSSSSCGSQCGSNCSCSSSSSSSSSTSDDSSSDSDSSDPENRKKQEEKRQSKKMKKKLKIKHHDQSDEVNITIDNSVPPPEPPTLHEIIPPPLLINESDLDTDVSLSDEDFYDEKPQLANKVEEKPSQPPTPAPTPVPLLSPQVVSPSVHRKSTPNRTPKTRKRPKMRNVPKYPFIPKTPLTSFKHPFMRPSPAFEKKKQTVPLISSDIDTTPNLDDSGRSSKRKRKQNRFYGYSDEEDDNDYDNDESEEYYIKPPPFKKKILWKPSFSDKIPIQTSSPIPSYEKIRDNTFHNQNTSTPNYQKTYNSYNYLPPNTPEQIFNNYNSPYQTSATEKTSSSEDEVNNDEDVYEQRAPSVPDPPIERRSSSVPLYCYCQCPYDEVSEMIACDGDDCKIEWFHFECVGILIPPKGKWYCPQCKTKYLKPF